MYYRICELCGATLDPEETCDCRVETESEDENHLPVEKAGLMREILSKGIMNFCFAVNCKKPRRQ